MKKIILSLAVLVSLLTASAVQAASTPAAAPASSTSATNPQNTRMKDCAGQYHQQNVAKAQYKTFMSSCMKKSTPVSASPASSATSHTVTPTAGPAPAANVPSSMTPPASAMKP